MKKRLLQDQPPDGFLEDAPPDGFEVDGPPDGFEAPAKKNPPAVMASAAPGQPIQDIPDLTPAKNAYRKALAAYTNKDEAGIAAPLEEALRLDPTLVDAVGLKNAIERERAAGRPLFAEPQNVMTGNSFTDLGGEEDIFDRAAAGAADVVRRVTPALPSLEYRPKTAHDAVRAALTPILALSAPIHSEQGQRMAGAAGAGVAGSMASMVAAEPALEAFAGVDTPVGKLAMKASEKLSALAQDLQPDNPGFAEALASGAGSMALFMVPGTATGKIVSAIPRMGVLATRLAPALATGLPVILESATEAGGVFQKMVAEGKPREEAGKAAGKTFFANGILIGLTNKFGLNAEGAAALKKALMSAPMEAIQEAGQSIISALSSGDDVDWEDVATSAGVGAIIGAGAGGLTAGAQPKKAAATAPADQKAAPAQPTSTFTPATVGQKTIETVANQFPTMAKVLAGRTIPVPQEALNEGIRKAAVAGEAELIRSGDPVAADKAAMETFAKSIQPASGPASSRATPPDAGAIQDSQDMENDAIEPPEVVQVGGKAPREAVMAHARALYKSAVQEHIDSVSDLERFVIENGGIRAPTDRSLSEEFQKFPLHLKGRTQWDEMEQEAWDARVIPRSQTLEQAINAIKKRGKRPTLTEFIGQAQRELDHEYEVYGPPKEGLKTAPDRGEVVPFEGREEYGVVRESKPAYNPGGPPRAEFIGWQDSRGHGENFPLYNIRGSHPRAGSTVGVETLKSEGVDIPQTPTFEEWKASGGSLRDKQPGLFGGAEPIIIKRGKPGDPAQMTLFGQKAQPKFEVPGSAFHVQSGMAGVRSFFEFMKTRQFKEAERALAGVDTNVLVKFENSKEPGYGHPLIRQEIAKREIQEREASQGEINLSTQAKQLAMTSEGKHQTDMVFPRALQESVVIKDLVEQGYLPVPKMRIDSPEDTAVIFHFLKNESVESFYVVSMDADSNILGSELVSVGILDSTLVHPRDALKGATMLGAKKISIIHNHPSGDPTPSTEDKVLTKRLSAAAKSAGIELTHHVVINDTKYGVIQPDGTVSMEERGEKPEMTGQMRRVKPTRSGESAGPKISSPEMAMEYVKGVQGSRKGVVVIAMDTKLKPTGVWHVGETFQPADKMASEIGKISMRNNARGVIIVSDRMPTPQYMRDLNAKMDATWGVEVFDVTSAERGEVISARAMGVLRDTPEPYGGQEVKPEGKETPGQKVDQDIYDANRRAARRGWFSKTAEELSNAGKDAKTSFFAKNLAPLSHTLKSIAPEIKSRMRRFEFDVSRKTAADIKAVMPFVESVKKLSTEDRVDLDLARKNGDSAKITGILSRNGLTDKYREVRSVLNNAYWRAKSAGMKLDFRGEYNPRIMKDAEGFMNAVMTRENASEIMAAIREQERSLKKTLAVEERAALVNSMLRGYGSNKITLTPPGNVKRRTREIVDAGTNPYYYDSDAALLMYLERMNEAIEARRFFGKGAKDMPVDTINDSIGAYTMDLVGQGKISPQDEMRLREALQSRFSDKKMSLFWKTYRDISYMETMGSFSSALTQLEDLALAWYRGGLLGGTKAIAKAFVGKTRVTAKDLGIDKVSQEFRDGRQVQGALEKVFKSIGLGYLDSVGKNSNLEAALEPYQREARAGQFSPGNLRRIRASFGEDGSTQIMEDLAEGKITQDVKFLLFSDLLDVQPVAKSEMAQGYLESGDARIFWMLKSFLIKRLNFTLDETVRLMGKPETRKEGIQNMFRLLPLMVLAGMGADAIKDVVFNRFTKLSDRVADNIFKLFAISKFTVYEARQRGLSKAIYGMFLPPMKLVDSVGRDTYSLYRAANEGKEFEGFETVASIPVVGKLFYWWFGKGAKKTEKAKEKAGVGRGTRSTASRPTVQRQTVRREAVRR